MANLQELLAASALILTCEKIASSGVLCQADEMDLRVLIVRSCKAFEIDRLAERALEPFPGEGAYS